jgi:hypothetical protein
MSGKSPPGIWPIKKNLKNIVKSRIKKSKNFCFGDIPDSNYGLFALFAKKLSALRLISGIVKKAGKSYN